MKTPNIRRPWFVLPNGSIYHRIIDFSGRCVASTAGGSHDNPYSKEEIENHAALISAAPDLLEALEEIIEHEFDVINPLRARAAYCAIAIAKGGAV